MKKIMIAALGLSMLSGSLVFAQNTSSGTDTNTMKSTKKAKKSKKTKSSTATSTMPSN